MRGGRQLATPASSMGKIIFWIVVVFVVLFVLRLLNVAKAARARRAAAKRAAGRRRGADGPLRALRRVPAPARGAADAAQGYRCARPRLRAQPPR